MDKCKLLEEVERPNTSKTKLGLKVLSFCFCAVFLGSVLLNVYYIRNMTENKNGVHNGHNIQHGHGLASSIKKFIPKMAADKNARQEKRSSKKQCDGTDCGDGYCCNEADYPVCCPGDHLWCGATADDCPSSIKKLTTMAADKRSSKKDCDGTDCGNGWCCNESDYPVCCPVADDGTQWCADVDDDCPSSIKKLSAMAADKRSYKKDCDGTDCGNNWCCNESDYPVCCPVGDDGTQWCADEDDDCPSSIKKLPTMAADKRSSKEYCGGGYCNYPYYCCTDGWSYYCCL